MASVNYCSNWFYVFASPEITSLDFKLKIGQQYIKVNIQKNVLVLNLPMQWFWGEGMYYATKYFSLYYQKHILKWKSLKTIAEHDYHQNRVLIDDTARRWPKFKFWASILDIDNMRMRMVVLSSIDKLWIFDRGAWLVLHN